MTEMTCSLHMTVMGFHSDWCAMTAMRRSWMRKGMMESITQSWMRTFGETTRMDRLTKWNGKKWVLPQGRTSDGESYWRIIAERLAEYENTMLTPAEIERMKRRKS